MIMLEKLDNEDI